MIGRNGEVYKLQRKSLQLEAATATWKLYGVSNTYLPPFSR